MNELTFEQLAIIQQALIDSLQTGYPIEANSPAPKILSTQSDTIVALQEVTAALKNMVTPKEPKRAKKQEYLGDDDID